MIIIFIVFFIISYIKKEKTLDVYECIGASINNFMSINWKVKDYRLIRNLRYLNSKKNFERAKIRFINYKLSSMVLAGVLFYYYLKLFHRITPVGWLYAFASLLFIIYLPDFKLNDKVKKQKGLMKSKLPNFLMKLNLLMGSGMSSIGALKKISHHKRDCLELLISKVIKDIEAGQSIEDSFHELAQQCQDGYITQFSRIIVQDKKYGTNETIKNLELICNEVWKNKKMDILKKGEEASTKLLLPMMIALIAILIAVTVPALSQLFKVQ